VPGDPGQVIYVWWDALANYVTALAGSAYEKWWLESDERVHVIGKGVVRFHAVYWLALLLSAGLPLPTAIEVHGYLTVDGAKISKSAGNTVDPAGLAAAYGTDAVRWWLLRDVPTGGDADFRVERLVTRANQDLANGLGNLVNRVLGLTRRREVTPFPDKSGLSDKIDDALAGADFRAATGELLGVVDRANRAIETERPWEPGRDAILGELLGTCAVLAHELTPFLPGAAGRLHRQLAANAPEPLFARL
jgi:methionyl-tRNA synthetase